MSKKQNNGNTKIESGKTVQDLIDWLDSQPDDLKQREVICQFCSMKDNQAWNCAYSFIAVPDSDLMQLKIFHPQLQWLPEITKRELEGKEQPKIQVVSGKVNR